MRGKRSRYNKKLYAAGYLQGQGDPTASARRHVALAVCNVVGAAGLLGLVSYGFLSGTGHDAVERPGGRTADFEVEPTRATAEAPVPVALASLAPRLVEREPRLPVLPVPEITNSVLLPSGRQSPPEDAVQLRGPMPPVDETGFGGGATVSVETSSELRRVVITGVPGMDRSRAPLRLASLGPIADVMPGPRATRGDMPPDAFGLGIGSIFREAPRNDAGRQYDAIPEPAPVPLVRRNDNSDVLVLSFALPPFAMRDVDAEARGDLMEAEEAARDAIAERSLPKERRLARERYCLAAAIYYEARGEPRNGQLAVAQVVLNRVKDPRYPNTICGVVFQDENRKKRCQFSFACDGRPERPRPGIAWTAALEIAKEFQTGLSYAPVTSATHYHADYVRPRWSRSNDMTRIRQIGRHIFYSES